MMTITTAERIRTVFDSVKRDLPDATILVLADLTCKLYRQTMGRDIDRWAIREALRKTEYQGDTDALWEYDKW
jgi:hypothetical protein